MVASNDTSPDTSPANQAITLFADAMVGLDDKQAEWLTALFYAALDTTPADPVAAVKKAIASLKQGRPSSPSLSIALAFDPNKHPRRKKGQEGGGQFVRREDGDSGPVEVNNRDFIQRRSKKKRKNTSNTPGNYRAEESENTKREEESEEEKLRAEFEQYKEKKQESKYTSAQLREMLDKDEFFGPMKSFKVASKVMESALPVGPVKRHGMSAEEEMVGIEIDGIAIEWAPGTPDKTLPAQMFIQKMMNNESIPPGLMRGTKRITFTKQSNKDDTYWKALYVNFTSSAATAGDGSIVVYDNEPISNYTLAHEVGHNLANEIWGTTKPPSSSRYGKAQKKEFAVTPYGDNSPDEDFAEACRLYASPRTRPTFERDFPLKFAALQEIIEEGGGGSILLQPQGKSKKKPMGPPEHSGGEGTGRDDDMIDLNNQIGEVIVGSAWQATDILNQTYPDMENLVDQYVQNLSDDFYNYTEGEEEWDEIDAADLIDGFDGYLQDYHNTNVDDEEDDELMPPSQKQVDYGKDDYPNIDARGKQYITTVIKETGQRITEYAKRRGLDPVELMTKSLNAEMGFRFKDHYEELRDFVEREMAKW